MLDSPSPFWRLWGCWLRIQRQAQEFVVGYSKAPEQPQSSARPICHSHTMTRTGAQTSHHAHCCIGARRATHCATGDDIGQCHPNW